MQRLSFYFAITELNQRLISSRKVRATVAFVWRHVSSTASKPASAARSSARRAAMRVAA